METKKCVICNIEFETKYKMKKYCSDKCKQKNAKIKSNKFKEINDDKPSYQRECLTCGKKFSTRITSKIYCNKVCLPSYYVKKNAKKLESVKKICVTCGEEFVTQYKSQIYCNKKCTPGSNRYILTCIICHKEFNSSSKTTVTCSQECLGKHFENKRELKGKDKINRAKSIYNSHESAKFLIRSIVEDIINKGKEEGISINGRNIDYRNIELNEKIKDMILERDDYKCRVCNSEVNLHVHHIIPRQFGGSHDEDNLITLCAKCHMHIETGNVEHAIQKCVKNYINVLNDTGYTKNSTLTNKEIMKSQNEFIKGIFEKLTKIRTKNDEIEGVMCSIDNFLDNLSFN